MKVKEGFECLYEDANDSDDLLEIKPSNRKSSNESDSSDKPSTVEQSKDTISDNESSFETPEKVLEDKPTTINPYQYLIDEIADMSDPVELLRYLQKRLIKGRKLDISTASDVDPEELQNATNYISVDRENILKTTFEELESISDFCTTFEVDFMGEIAKDYGGPRKEWIHLVNSAMKDKYFEKGLRELLAEDYYYVGVMMGIALLQNGQTSKNSTSRYCQFTYRAKHQCLYFQRTERA